MSLQADMPFHQSEHGFLVLRRIDDVSPDETELLTSEVTSKGCNAYPPRCYFSKFKASPTATESIVVGRPMRDLCSKVRARIEVVAGTLVQLSLMTGAGQGCYCSLGILGTAN